AGDHIVLCDDVYGGSFRIIDKVFAHLGITATRVDMTDLGATERAITDQTKLVWIETPTNPMPKVIDIEAVSQLTRRKTGGKAGAAGAWSSSGEGAMVVVDNTFATPYLQNPLALGADIVTHSCTKYI